MLSSRSKNRGEVIAGDSGPVTLLSMANRRAPTPGAQWGMRAQMLPEEKLAIYNRQRSAEGHLTMGNDQVYSGLLRFTYCPDGSNTTKSHDLHVTSEMTCADVVPLLRRQLVPHLNGMADTALGHISLVQGEMERVLEDSDKPLEIALECSTKGLASPRFIFRPVADPLSSDSSASHRMRTSGFTSYVGALTAHSNPNLAMTSSTANQSPHLPTPLDHHHHWISTDGEQNSLYSADSYNSLSSGGRSARRLYHMSKSVPALEQKPNSSPQRRKFVPMLSSSEHDTSPTSTVQFLQPPAAEENSPSSNHKMTRAKNSVGNFFTRSLRVHKKLKAKGKAKMSLYDGSDTGSHGSPPMSREEKEASAQLSNLASPLLADRRLTMSTVMHIHYKDASGALIYKSLLVSQKAKTREVVLEALKRFDLTMVDPKDFSLFEVVGCWQDVSQSVENETSVDLGTTISLSSMSLLSVPRPAVTSIEEFVVCYSRAVGPNECPYNLQFYFSTQDGYTRRFELRQRERHMHTRMISRSHAALDVKDDDMHQESTPKRLSWANTALFCNEGSPLFGDTSHRKRSKRHNKVSDSMDSTVLEGSETEEDILDEVKVRDHMGGVDGKVTSRVKLVDEMDALEVCTPQRRQVLLSATSSSPDSGVVSFGKDKKPRHNSTDVSSTTTDQHHLESASLHTTTPTHSTVSPSLTELVKMKFLLNLKLQDSEKELLIQPLEATTVHITAGRNPSTPDGSVGSRSTQCVRLHHPGLQPDAQPLCSLQLQTKLANTSFSKQADKVYVLHPTHPDLSVHLNGNLVVEPMPLSHGDLISLYKENYLFLFQDYSSTTRQSSRQYKWRPHPHNHAGPSSPILLSTPPPSSPIVKEMLPMRKDTQYGDTREETDQNYSTLANHSPLSPYSYHSQPNQDTVFSQPSSLLTSTDLPGSHSDVACQTPTPIQGRRHTVPDGDHLDEDLQQRPSSAGSHHHRTGSDTPTQAVGLNSLKRLGKSHHRSHHPSSSTSSISSMASSSPSRKSLFSFDLSEEAELLRYLVTDLDVSRVSCCLGPALLLGMCTEYCHKCHGSVATSRFMQRTVDSLQEVVWKCTKRLTQWKPDPAMATRPLSHCEGLFPLLQPVVFWLANALELHHLLTHSCSSMTIQPSKKGESPITILHNILVYSFQQMFYTVSKVLFYSLPLVLDGCKSQEEGGEMEGGGEDEIVEQAVDFLQALLDLMTDLHLHLEVVCCFYANLFFFINTTLLNSVMQLGPKRGIFTHSAGVTLRSSLTLLEGWACQVGFKDAVLHHLAKLSSILDILAMPPRELIQLSWSELREEFPVLHPAQLHLLLSHYTPPSSLSSPSHWAPTATDTSPAHDSALVSESYDTHPGFTLPLDSYTLQLNKTPPQHAKFQALVEDLHATLKHNTKSVDVVPVIESAPSARVPTFTSITTPPTSHHYSNHHNHQHHHSKCGEGKRGAGDKRQDVTRGDDTLLMPSRESEATLKHSRSHDSLDNNNMDSAGIGNNTESQEDLLDTHNKNRLNRHNRNTMGEKSNSGSKVAELITSYEETAKLSQSSSDSVKSFKVERARGDEERERGEVERARGDVERARGDVERERGDEERARGDVESRERGRVGRVMSMVTEHAYSKPQTLLLREVEGCDESIVEEEWMLSAFPNGAHQVNIQRGSKGFGIVLVEQKDPLTGNAAIYVQCILPGSTADQCESLTAGDRVLAIDGQRLDGADYIIAEKYMKEAEDDVQLILAPRPLKIHSQ